MGIRYFILGVILCIMVSPANVFASAMLNEYHQDEYSQNEYTGNTEPVARIMVKKSERIMQLLDKKGNVLRSYRIALGKSPVGKKIAEGDNKTPEGDYIIDFRNEASSYFRSLRISYPAPSDISRAKKMGVNPGGDIFIHGMPNERSWMWWKYNDEKDWTNGCIAVKNTAMRELWETITPGTPISIRP